jgi:hypothetical protein
MPSVPGVVAVAFEENAVGKTISDTKVRTTWRIQLNGIEKEVELTNSRISRRKKVFVNQKLLHEDSSFFGAFAFTWKMNQFQFAILSNAKETGFDLFVNDVNFFDLLASRSSRPSSSQRASKLEEQETLELQRAIELSLRDEAKRVPPPAKPTQISPNKPVIVQDLISFDDAPLAPPRPITPNPPLPEHLFTQQQEPRESFALNADSPKEAGRSDDPIMDWFQERKPSAD